MDNEIIVPFFSFQSAPKGIRKEWLAQIIKVIDSGVFVNGFHKKSFEEKWSSTINAGYSIGVGNGLDGLVLALKTLKIGIGCKVAVPAHTFIATWNAVEIVGATPIGIDVDPNGLMDLEMLEKLNVEIDAVIPVHMHGKMVDMERLCNWATRKSVKIIEDASQSHLARQGEKYAGTWGAIGVFSLYPTKNLGALGDSGVIVTNSLELKKRLETLSNYGSSQEDKYRHLEIGINSRLDEIQAACLLVNLENLPIYTDRRNEIAKKYLTFVKNNRIRFLNSTIEQSNVWHHFPIISTYRDSLKKYLAIKGIGTEIHYPFAAGSEFLQIKGSVKSDFPRADQLSSEILSLPNHPWLSNKQIDYVVGTLNSFEA